MNSRSAWQRADVGMCRKRGLRPTPIHMCETYVIAVVLDATDDDAPKLSGHLNDDERDREVEGPDWALSVP